MTEKSNEHELPPPTSLGKDAPLRDQMYTFLTVQQSGNGSRVYHYYLDALVALSMITLCLSSVPSLLDDPWESRLWYAVESFIAVNFLLDIFLKAGSATPTTKYVYSWTALTDVLSVVPWVVETVTWVASMHSLAVREHAGDKLERLNVLRLLRMLRFGRFYSATFAAFPDMHLFVQAVRQSRLAVVFLVIFVTFSGIFFSSLLFFAETASCHYDKLGGRWILSDRIASPSPSSPSSPSPDTLCTFQNIFEAAWFVMVTITTVGYGDVQLKSSLAKVITVLMMICSVIGLSLPVAIFGANLTELYLERRLGKRKREASHLDSPVKALNTDDMLLSIMAELSAIKRRLDQLEQ